MLLERKPILEARIASHDASLEDAIRRDFGEAGFAKFRMYNVQIEVPAYPGIQFSTGFEAEERIDFNTGKPKGKSYEIYSRGIYYVSAENATFSMSKGHEGEVRCLLLFLDLNPANENARYLTLAFDFEK